MKKGFFIVFISVLLSGLAAYGVVKAANDAAVAVPQSGQGFEYRTVNLSQTDYPDFTFAAESAVDAVVYVEVTVKSTRQYQQMDPFFRFFFGDDFGTPQSREQKGSGSGVIIRSDGYIVTNNHVVNGASSISVVLNNNKTYEATVVGTDPATDVAIIKIEAEGLPTIPFGDSDELRLGEWVLAIGSPLNLRSTITAGIVSAKGRSMRGMGNYDAESLNKIESFIQTDAAVNPGNSGGALVNKRGELVGINTAIVSQTGSYSGYSFAVPVNIVKKIAADLIDFGTVKRALLGVTMQAIDDKIAKDLKLSSMNGVYINEVLNGSAADKAGLRKGDVLTAIGSYKITDMASVQERVNGYRPGDKATVTYIRDGREHTAEVTFQSSSAATGTVDAEGTVAFYGARLKAASEETLSRLGLKNGVEIVSVGPGKMMEAGVTAGYVIQYVNDESVSKPEDVVKLAGKAKRSVFIQGGISTGKPSYFGFGKDGE